MLAFSLGFLFAIVSTAPSQGHLNTDSRQSFIGSSAVGSHDDYPAQSAQAFHYLLSFIMTLLTIKSSIL